MRQFLLLGTSGPPVLAFFAAVALIALEIAAQPAYAVSPVIGTSPHRCPAMAPSFASVTSAMTTIRKASWKPWAKWVFARFVDTLSLVGRPTAQLPGRGGWRLVAHLVSRSRLRNPASPAAASPAATTRRIIAADQEMLSRGG